MLSVLDSVEKKGREIHMSAADKQMLKTKIADNLSTMSDKELALA